MNVLAIDPSLTCWGMVKVSGQGQVIEAICIETKREAKKRRIYAGDDDARRLMEIEAAMCDWASNADQIWAEQPAGAQHYRSAKTEGMMLGILVGMVADRLYWVQARDVKKALTGYARASKDDMVRHSAFKARVAHVVAAQTSKARKEAIADACGVLLCSGVLG